MTMRSAAAHLAARADERGPAQGVGRFLLRQEYFDFAGVPFAMAIQARWKHARIVEDQAIAGMEE